MHAATPRDMPRRRKSRTYRPVAHVPTVSRLFYTTSSPARPRTHDERLRDCGVSPH
jgi:hypothetical protein